MRFAIKKLFILALGALLAATTLANGLREGVASGRAEPNSIELYQALLDLQNPWTVMCVAAHPDDEDGATLTILRRKQGVHTVTVFSTYGEGGQNAVGPELYEELGAIRARETREAATIQGSEPYFLGLRDFGFSKSAEEAFRIWGHDEALRRLVLKIRELRPDVIITNHDTVSGHGHHQATGRLVLEAFDAAADASRFPEQLRNGVGTWQVQRLFVRFQFQAEGSGKSAEDEAARCGKVVSIDPNERDPIRNKTYAEQALEALQRHATQGPWPKTLPTGGRPTILYRLVRSAKDAPLLPPNSQTVLDGFQRPPSSADRLIPLDSRALLENFALKSRVEILEALLTAHKSGFTIIGMVGAGEVNRLARMTERMDEALVKASGLEAKLFARNDVLIPGTATPVTLRISNNGVRNVKIVSLKLRGLLRPAKLRFPQTLTAGSTISIEMLSATPRTAGLTVPAAEHLYDGRLLGEKLSATVNVEIDGAAFPISETMQLGVAPAVEIAQFVPSPLVLTPGVLKQPPALMYRLINHSPGTFEGHIVGASSRFNKVEFVEWFTLKPGEVRDKPISLGYLSRATSNSPMVSTPVSDSLTLNLFGSLKGKQLLTNRTLQIIPADAQTAPDLLVGYIRSFDETLRDSLRALGVQAKELTVDDVRTSDLSAFQTIIIDNRGYQAHPELIAANSRLLDFVRDGGTLIVFYHRTNEWNPDPKVSRPQLAPYPIMIGGSRVTDENAPIEFIDRGHPLLNSPNKITQNDFASWIQERGLYYPETWDSHYSAPFATSDAGEKPLRGGLLAADYGRGHYIYTSMVWYRQLRAGNPGAYRMLANMISYGRNQMMNSER
ncbi:MAG: hypothetical protein QOJ64_897 [Acidobacteriota bacterium]|jgi:LmbE family N-acetylglucosaminyl deacetylase|nr:hypothetical protein [Acidobacteriota bacterium]